MFIGIFQRIILSPMTEAQTSIARLVRVRPDLLEARYLPGCTLSTTSLAEVRRARQELMGERPYAMLSFLPEDLDFELTAMNVDHLKEDREEGHLLAIAIVVRANMVEMVLKLYFSYYPWLRRIKVTDSEEEARSWMDEQFKELAAAGND